jgi:hypothetical protein
LVGPPPLLPVLDGQQSNATPQAHTGQKRYYIAARKEKEKIYRSPVAFAAPCGIVADSFWVMTKRGGKRSEWVVMVGFIFFKLVFFFFFYICAIENIHTTHRARPPELRLTTNRLLLFLATVQADAPPTLLLQPPRFFFYFFILSAKHFFFLLVNMRNYFFFIPSTFWGV